MPKKYQNPKLEIRKDVARPFYFIRVAVPIVTAEGMKRRRIVRTLGFTDEINKTRAMELRADELQVVNAGRTIAQAQIRFSELGKRFLDIHLPTLGKAVQNRYRTQMERHILPAFGDMMLLEIDRPKVQEWLNGKVDSYSWWTRTGLKAVLSAVFKVGQDWRLWPGENPTLGVKIGRKIYKREKRLLSVDDLRRLLAALPDRLRFMVLIMFGTGLRVSETLGLRWRDIDMDGAILSPRRRWYRGDLSRDSVLKSEGALEPIRLSASMLAEFRQRYPGPHAREQFVFVGEDGVNPPDDRDLLRHEFRPILKRLGLHYEGFGWHAFRRQNITWRQHIGGATPLEAQKAARHTSLDMTLLYTLTDAERETQQQQRMFDHLLGLPDSGTPQ